MNILEVIGKSKLVNVEALRSIRDKVLHNYFHAQIFRTRTEMEVSILNDVDFPTPDAKYWQAVREQAVHFSELIALSFEYRKNEVKIRQLQRRIEEEQDELKRELLEIELERRLWRRTNMERVARDREREILEWQDIIDRLPVQYSKEDPNEHQLVSYTKRWIQQFLAMGSGGTPSERWNLIGQLDMGLRECKRRGCIEEVWREFAPEAREYIEGLGLGRDALSEGEKGRSAPMSGGEVMENERCLQGRCRAGQGYS